MLDYFCSLPLENWTQQVSILFAENIEYLKFILIDLINKLVVFLSAETSFFKDSVGAFQTVGMVLVMAMIPFGIAIVQELISPEKRHNFPKLDLHVILSEVIPAKNILIAFALVFLSPIAWNVQGTSTWFDSLFLILWVVGIILLLKIFSNLFHWTRSDNQKESLREKILEKIADGEEKKDLIRFDVWEEIWQQSDNDISKFRYEFFDIFNTTIFNLPTKYRRRLLKIYADNIQKRSFFLSSDGQAKCVVELVLRTLIDKFNDLEIKNNVILPRPGVEMYLLIRLLITGEEKKCEKKHFTNGIVGDIYSNEIHPYPLEGDNSWARFLNGYVEYFSANGETKISKISEGRELLFCTYLLDWLNTPMRVFFAMDINRKKEKEDEKMKGILKPWAESVEAKIKELEQQNQ